jgi:hypothetical protein
VPRQKQVTRVRVHVERVRAQSVKLFVHKYSLAIP